MKFTCQIVKRSGGLINKVDTLKQLVREREVKVGRLETEVEHMNNTITTYLDLANRENMSTPAGRKESKPEKPEKDCLVFHGVKVDDMERMTGDEDIRKNFLDHNIKNLLRAEWDIECAAPFKHVFRWSDGPRVNGVEP